MRVLLVLASMCLAVSAAAIEQTIVFVNGASMTIQSYEVKGGTVQFTTLDGRLQSVPRSYVNLVATEQANGGGGSSEPARAPEPPPPPPPAAPEPMPTETVRPEAPITQPTPAPPPPPAPSTPAPDMTAAGSPPPVWSNDDLHVSLVVPSASWTIEDMPPSFDVAVALDNESTEARATLALIRQELRGRNESIAWSPTSKRRSRLRPAIGRSRLALSISIRTRRRSSGSPRTSASPPCTTVSSCSTRAISPTC